VYPTNDIRAGLYVDALLGKHFALLGSTGTGKSTSAALILHRICEHAPEGHIVMIDPHGEYGAAFRTTGMIFDVSNLQMPYWLMNFEEHCEVFLTSTGNDRQEDADILSKCLLAARSKNRMAEQHGQDHGRCADPLPAVGPDQSDHPERDGQARQGDQLRAVHADQDQDRRIEGRSALPVHVLGHAGGRYDGRIHRQDLPPAKRGASRSRSSTFRACRPTSLPPSSPCSAGWCSISRSGRATRRPGPSCWSARKRTATCPTRRTPMALRSASILSRIAKEGRKYGISLGLITQRPSDLAEGVLSQCGTIISMRLNNDRDQAFVKAAMPEGARGFLDSIPALRNRECIICGEGVSIPIRVDLRRAGGIQAPGLRKTRRSPSCGASGGGEDEMVQRTVQRWRAQGR
jgi:hypothetical protein